MPIRFVPPTKYLVLSLLALLMFGTSVYAQSETPRPHADFVSDKPTLFITVQNTDTNLEEFNTFFAKLAVNSGGEMQVPHLAGSSVRATLDLLGFADGLSEYIVVDDAWIGDHLSLALQNNKGTTYLFVMLDIADSDLLNQSIKETVEVVQYDGYTTLDTDLIIKDDILFMASRMDYAELDPIVFMEMLNTQTTLSSSTAYQAGFNNLPLDTYPISGYLAMDEVIKLTQNDNRRNNPLDSVDLDADMVFGIHSPDQRTLTFDVVHPTLAIMDDITPINIGFSQNIPADVHVAFHSVDAELPLKLLVNSINHMSQSIPENTVDGYQLFNVGGLLKHALITTVAGFTGLNIESDVIEEIESDYALMFRVIPEHQWIEAGFVADMDDNDAVSYIFESLTEASQRYGVDVSVQERILHAPNLLKMLIDLQDSHTITQHPSLELSIIHQDNVLAAGSTPLVNHAIGRDGTLAQQEAYQSALGHHPNNLIGVLYLNTQAIAETLGSTNAQMLGLRTDELANLQRLFVQAESFVFSTHVSDNLPVSRVTITLPEAVPTSFDVGATSADSGE